ncbi:HD domain-containing protein [Dyadobacter pollutisoli]|uniref:HD domain-containing protein n=1 Tax=Dyadobacter pollutisoli TaxID=2910158 RepID=A0A9E8NCS2_9BACT|nr:HD domain-containing protein [Dyadobacter pollutisoli]WAC14305.1 HD domain-containing protein [Dyadobacter pollutisoli]
MNVEQAKSYITGELRASLDTTLYYHGFHHTLDVTNAALRLAEAEHIREREALQLLETAALFHDSGFLNTYNGHEQEGCRIVSQVLPDFEFSEKQIAVICGMIMATKIPQAPQTLLEKIICDADLDYLGRDDFEQVAATLFEELKIRGMVTDISTWNQIQVRFLETHQYWTSSAQSWRDAAKQAHLKSLKATVLR